MENIPARRDLPQLQGIEVKFALPSIGVPERNVQDFWQWITVFGRL